MCVREYANSRKATNYLTTKIIAQDPEYQVNIQMEKRVEKEIKKEKDKYHEGILEYLRRRMTKDKLRANDLAQMKGASSWLTSLPLKKRVIP